MNEEGIAADGVPADAEQPWFRKKRYALPLVVIVAALVALLALAAGLVNDGRERRTSRTIPDATAACSEMFAEGRRTDDVLADFNSAPCQLQDATLFLSVIGNKSCSTGATLNWLDQGWGFSGGTWHRFEEGAEHEPPQTALDVCDP